ncbi:phage portal protein [Lysinibacillus sp. FSL M8-0355]|uniref:phage portal protein n=1 Tax=Lysinibacillus sp. FSL M8-0355 TaxID=2921719 RepID=UPI0030F98693
MNTKIQNKILRKLKKGIPINSEMIDELLQDHKSKITDVDRLWNRYLGDAPIKKREMPEYALSNEKITNDFFSLIVNNKTGFFSGVPINYTIDKNSYGEIDGEISEIASLKHKSHSNVLTEFLLRNNMPDLDAEMTKIVSVCGDGVRKYYTDKQGYTRVVNLKMNQVIVLLNEHKEVEYALRFFKDYNDDDELVTYVEFYDEFGITYFVENTGKDKDKIKYILDADYSDNPVQHVFDFCPFVYFQNNEESMSDGERVFPLIDAYNTVLSNNNNELNGFSMSLLLFKSKNGIDDKVVKSMIDLGALDLDPEDVVEYLTKTLDATFSDSFLDRVEQNIFQFSESVNFNDEKFNNLSGIALKHKLQALSNKCIALEAKFKRSLTEQFKIITSGWKKIGIDIDYLDIYFTFKRNLPPDLEYEANWASKMQETLSHKSVLDLMTSVDNSEYELLEWGKEQQSSYVQLTNPNTPVEELYNVRNLEEGNADESK